MTWRWRSSKDSTHTEHIGNILQLKVSHSGGCGEHDFALFMSPATFTESNPVQASLSNTLTRPDYPCLDPFFKKSVNHW